MSTFFFYHWVDVATGGLLVSEGIIRPVVSRYIKCGEVMVLNVTFSNISVISWRSVFLVEETRVPGENHRSVASH